MVSRTARDADRSRDRASIGVRVDVRTLVVCVNVTLDGVMQAPARADETEAFA
jgi:hypothetical protein